MAIKCLLQCQHHHAAVDKNIIHFMPDGGGGGERGEREKSDFNFFWRNTKCSKQLHTVQYDGADVSTEHIHWRNNDELHRLQI